MSRAPGLGGDPYGGSAVADLGDPVDLLSDRGVWDNPQYLPGSPHNLPPPDSLLRRPGAPAAPAIFDPHHYARNVTNIAQTVDDVGGAVLLQSSQLRNMLGLRNVGSTAGEFIYVSFGTPASANDTWLALDAGESVFFDVVVPQDDVYAIATTGASPRLAIAYSLVS